MIWIPYCGTAPEPAELLGRWNFDPPLLAVLAAVIFGYLHWFRDGSRLRGAAFAGSVALAAFLFISPFCALSSALFSARVVHHIAIVALLAPLIVITMPVRKLRPPGGVAGWTAIQTVLFWLWHAPSAYAWALSNDAAYWLMQASLLFGAAGFWAAIRRAPAPASAAALLATTVQMGLLGALITFSGGPLYAPHLLTTAAWELSPLEDQQVAGLIMWAPGAAFYLAAALLLVSRLLNDDERRVAHR